MITVNDIKPYQDTLWEGGDRKPYMDVLILASCRGIALANYLLHYNEMVGGVRVTYIRASDYHTTADGQPQDALQAIERLVKSERFAQVVRRTTHFVFEHHENYGLLNTDGSAVDGIMNRLWASGRTHQWRQVPAWNNIFILEDDIRSCLPWWNEAANIISPVARQQLLEHTSGYFLGKFCANTRRTSYPQFADWFMAKYRTQRLCWTHNHVTKAFTEELFKRLNLDLLGLPLTERFWREIEAMPDLYENPHTNVTPLDKAVHGMTWE